MVLDRERLGLAGLLYQFLAGVKQRSVQDLADAAGVIHHQDDGPGGQGIGYWKGGWRNCGHGWNL
jgi:hypothetical protein